MKKQSQQEKESFWGPQYGSIYPALEGTDPYKALLQKIKDYIHPQSGEQWLDIGTGSGAMVDLIWEKSDAKIGNIVALDLTEVMLNHLRNRLPKLTPPLPEEKIDLVKHDLAKKLPFDDASFDGAISSLVITYIAEHEGTSGEDALLAVLKEVNRVLKPGAQFVWTTPKQKVNFARVFAGSWKEIFNPKKIKNLYYGPAILGYALEIQKKGKTGEYNFLSEERFREMCSEAGFEVDEITYSFSKQALVLNTHKKK